MLYIDGETLKAFWRRRGRWLEEDFSSGCFGATTVTIAVPLLFALFRFANGKSKIGESAAFQLLFRNARVDV